MDSQDIPPERHYWQNGVEPNRSPFVQHFVFQTPTGDGADGTVSNYRVRLFDRFGSERLGTGLVRDPDSSHRPNPETAAAYEAPASGLTAGATYAVQLWSPTSCTPALGVGVFVFHSGH